MKKVFLICFSFICFFAIGQTRVTSSGISIQGVARDSQGNSFANVENFLVNIYLYRLDNNTKTPIHFLLDESFADTEISGLKENAHELLLRITLGGADSEQDKSSETQLDSE